MGGRPKGAEKACYKRVCALVHSLPKAYLLKLLSDEPPGTAGLSGIAEGGVEFKRGVVVMTRTTIVAAKSTKACNGHALDRVATQRQ